MQSSINISNFSIKILLISSTTLYLVLGAPAKVIIDIFVCSYILSVVIVSRKKNGYIALSTLFLLTAAYAVFNQNPTEFIATFLTLPLLLFPLYLFNIERFDNIVCLLLIIFLVVLSVSSLESVTARSSGLTASPTHLGLYAALLASLYIVHGNSSSILDFLLLCLLLIVALFCVYASGSRGAALILASVIIHKLVTYSMKKPVVGASFVAALFVIMLMAFPKFSTIEIRALSYNSHSDERRFNQITEYSLESANSVVFGAGRASNGSVGVNLYRLFPTYYNFKPDSAESLLITICISFGYIIGLAWFFAYLRFSKLKSLLFLCLPSIILFQGLEGPLFFVLFTVLHRFQKERHSGYYIIK